MVGNASAFSLGLFSPWQQMKAFPCNVAAEQSSNVDMWEKRPKTKIDHQKEHLDNIYSL